VSGQCRLGALRKLEAVRHAAAGVGCRDRELPPLLTARLLKRPVHLVGQVGDRHLRADDLNLRLRSSTAPNQAGVVGLGVGTIK